MAEIEILLPTVQYGNVRITGTPEEFGVELNAPGAIGEMAAVYLNLFTQGFKAGALRDVDYIPTTGNTSEPDSADMTAVATIQSELGASVVNEYNFDGPGDVDAAALDDNPYAQESDNDLPWEGKVKSESKPWERQAKPAVSKAAAPKAAKIDW